MGEFTDKAKGLGNKLAGEAKEGIGKAFDKPDLVAEGKIQEAKGHVQDATGEVKGALGDKV